LFALDKYVVRPRQQKSVQQKGLVPTPEPIEKWITGQTLRGCVNVRLCMRVRQPITELATVDSRRQPAKHGRNILILDLYYVIPMFSRQWEYPKVIKKIKNILLQAM
jgi:hypothetical protein